MDKHNCQGNEVVLKIDKNKIYIQHNIYIYICVNILKTSQSYFVPTGQDSEDPMSYIARARLEFDRMLPAGGWRVATSFAAMLE